MSENLDVTKKFDWYVVSARTNFEKSVARSLADRAKLEGIESEFGEILVPSEEVVEMKDGQKKKSERKLFPGYVLVQIARLDKDKIGMVTEAFHVVRGTPKVTGFIGGSAERPLPITEAEADRILNRVKDAAEKPRPKVDLKTGDSVRINEGPFQDFNGVVESVDVDKLSAKVMVLVFGRATPVDFKLSQLEPSVA